MVRLATAVRKTVVLASYTPPSAEALCREKDSYPAAVEVLYRVIKFAGVTQRGREADGKHRQDSKVTQATQGANSDTGAESSKEQIKSRKKRPGPSAGT